MLTKVIRPNNKTMLNIAMVSNFFFHNVLSCRKEHSVPTQVLFTEFSTPSTKGLQLMELQDLIQLLHLR